jgi:hypothetical protein
MWHFPGSTWPPGGYICWVHLSPHFPVYRGRASRHRMDILCTIQFPDAHQYAACGDLVPLSLVFLNTYRAELYCYHTPDEGPGHGLVQNAPFPLEPLCNCMDTGYSNTHSGCNTAYDNCRTDFNIGFFDPALGGDPILYQHLFWIYSHPAVYIMILPAMGAISEIIPTFARKTIFGYKAIIASTVAIAFVGYFVWGHHMFTSGMSGVALYTFPY